MPINRKITTNLSRKEDLFKVLALGEAIGLPLLLIGDPGVAKTKAVMDYAETALGAAITSDDIFLLETDEGTRSTAVKGHIDMEKLTTTNKYEILSPVCDAKFVIINEVDKASASLRNSLLGIMNEKILFNGKEKKACSWNTFIATCNSIPEDEKDSPFWDRFGITFKVERLREADMLEYFQKGGRANMEDYDVVLPAPGEVDANIQKLDIGKIKKCIDICYSKLSDRSLSYLPTLVANIMVVYQAGQDRAFVKAVELLVGKVEADKLAKNIMTKELRALYDKVDMVSASSGPDAYNRTMDEINKMAEALMNQGKLSVDDQTDLTARVAEGEKKLPFLTTEEEEEEILKEIADA